MPRESEYPRYYFDNAASSKTTDVCLSAFQAYDAQPWAGANPHALHTSGRQAFAALEKSRAELAHLLGARRPSEIILTSGGTESNNTALAGMVRGILQKTHGRRNRIFVSSIEHESVLVAAEYLQKELPVTVVQIPVDAHGVLDCAALEEAIDEQAALVSVMAANNEVGTIQPISRIAQIAHKAGALVHTDAVQAFGHIPFSVEQTQVDAASITAHKLGGPVGTGALYLRARTPFVPHALGGGQEGGLRAGTANVRGAYAFAAVAHDAVTNMDAYSESVHACIDRIVEGCCEGPDPVAQRTIDVPRRGNVLPGTLHLLIPGHQSQGLILALDERGFEVAGGSACSSSSLEPSHVLSAMGVPRDLAFCALRISIDHRCTLQACDAFIDALHDVCLHAPNRHRS